MKACTPLGMRNLPSLPKSELEALKKAMLDIFPVYKNSRVEFEAVWEKCIVALQQCCK